EDASPRPSALPPRRLPSMPPRRLRPPAQSTTPAGEAPDAPATPPSAPHRSTPRPPSVTSRQINQTEPTLHRFESHPVIYRKARKGRARHRLPFRRKGFVALHADHVGQT